MLQKWDLDVDRFIADYKELFHSALDSIKCMRPWDYFPAVVMNLVLIILRCRSAEYKGMAR